MGRISSTLTTAICAATLLTASVATAQGTLADRKTIVTFSGPVSLPGTTIPAGSYTFKLADSPADRHIVMVFDKEESKLITTLLAVPAQRNEARGDAVVSFKETPSDRPPAVRYWYYAGEKDGNEFVYPKAQAMMIAQASGETVQSVDTDSTDINAMKNGTVTTTSSTTSSTTAASTTSASTSTQSATSTMPESKPVTPAPTPTTTAPTTTAPTTTEPVASTAPVTPEPTTAPTTAPAPAPTTAPPVTAQPEPVGTSGHTELPKTSSSLPAFGLLGLFALAGALVARYARRSVA